MANEVETRMGAMLTAIILDKDYPSELNMSRIENILQSIIDNTEYDDPIYSRIEFLLLELKKKMEENPTIEELTVTQNGTYQEEGKAYSPVNVNVEGGPIIAELRVTENGTYEESGKAYSPVIVDVDEGPTIESLNVTANGTYSEEGKAYTPVVVNVEGYKLEDMPTGAIATITDAAALPLNDLKVSIEPVQSGSGDPSPINERPISGWNAANIANDTKYGGFIDFNQLIKNGNFVNTQDWNDVNATFTVSDNIATVLKTVASGYILQAIPHIANHKYFKIATVKGTSEVTMYFNGEFNSIVLNGDWQTVSRIYNATSSETHYLNFTTNEASDFTPYYLKNIMYMDLTQMFGETKANEIYAMEQSQAGSGVAYVKSLFPNDYYSYSASTPNTTVDTVNGETGRIINIEFKDGTNPLTVYGATIEPLTGLLTVTSGFKTLTANDIISTGQTSGGQKYAETEEITGAITLDNTAISSQYQNLGDVTTNNTFKILNTLHIRFYNNDFVDLEAAKTLLTGVQVKYKLATPITYQLNPTMIRLLEGLNNIFADTGDILEGEYFKEL